MHNTQPIHVFFYLLLILLIKFIRSLKNVEPVCLLAFTLCQCVHDYVIRKDVHKHTVWCLCQCNFPTFECIVWNVFSG